MIHRGPHGINAATQLDALREKHMGVRETFQSRCDFIWVLNYDYQNEQLVQRPAGMKKNGLSKE